MPDELPTTYAKGVPDAKGDPTSNVLQLVEAANLRQDDLRSSEVRYNDLRDQHSKELGVLRETYRAKLAEKESSRLDSIRQVDREDVNKTALAAQQAIKTLADQTTALKDTLQLQVANAATMVENRQQAFATEVNKRLSNLELQYSEGKGKSDVRDPSIDELVRVVGQLAIHKNEDVGKSSGMVTMAGWILSGILALVAIAGVVVAVLLRKP